MASRDPKHLAEVLARPMDDAPRLVLAELLTLQGDPRGAFIVAQCRLAERGLPPDVRARLKEETAAALRAHGGAWKAAATGLGECTLRRGFVDEVVASASALAQPCAGLFATEPVTRLTLREASTDTVRPLAEHGAFARVLRLQIHGSLGDEGALVLADALAKRTTPLLALNLGGAGIGAEGATALAAALRGCRSLALTNNALGDEGLTALAKAKPLSALDTLFVGDNDLTDEGILALAKSPNLTMLTRLGIARNDAVTTEGLGAIARSKKLKRLRWLEYSDEDDQYVLVRG